MDTRVGGARLLLAGLLLLLAGLPRLASAAIHEAIVPVADRGEAARQQAVRQALAEVLVRVSGDPELPQQAAVTPLLAEAGQYLQQYQYEGSEAVGDLMLRAGFDATALEARLRQQGLELWGRARPPLLLWLAVDDGQRRTLLGAEDADPLLVELRAAARRAALNLLLPLFDLEDQSRVSFTGIAAGDLVSVQRASQRYPTPAVLVGSLTRAADGWSGRWALRYAGRDSRWEGRAAALSDLLDQSMTQAAARLLPAAADRPAPQGLEGLRLRVEGVAGLAESARIIDYLSGLGPVRHAELVAAHGRALDFRVEVAGGAAGLERALVPGGLLEADRSGGPVPGGVAVYRLRY
ncbi:MAG: DUF2066 domain-containing protein [Gammaproteobacteria bacterium]